MRTDGNSARHHAILATIVSVFMLAVAGCSSSHTATAASNGGVSGGGVSAARRRRVGRENHDGDHQADPEGLRAQSGYGPGG